MTDCLRKLLSLLRVKYFQIKIIRKCISFKIIIQPDQSLWVTLTETTPKGSVTSFSLVRNRALKTLSLCPRISYYQVQINLKTLNNESCLAMFPSGQSSACCAYRNKLPSSPNRQDCSHTPAQLGLT